MSTTSGTLNLPEVRVEHWGALFDSEAVRTALRQYLESRRWYRSKARTVTGFRITGVVPIEGTESTMLIAAVEFAEGDCHNYLLTVRVERDGDHPRNDTDGQIIAGILSSDG